MLTRLAHRLLEVPVVFRIQQRMFNDYANVRATFEEYLAVEGKNILDVGCSSATCAGQIIDMERNTYVGVDIDPSYIELAKRSHPRGQFMKHDARALPFAPDSFDLVMFVGVLHHMDDGLSRSCMAEVQRVLRLTGVVLVAEPVFRLDWPVSSWFLERDRGKFIRERDEYRALLDGLSIVEEKTFRLSLHEFCGFVARKRRESLTRRSANGA
jgi:ubiquinone/menaquinone biosynthesis C-methylase UbiE